MKKISKRLITIFIIFGVLAANIISVNASSDDTALDSFKMELLTKLNIIDPADAKKDGAEFMSRAEFAMTIVRLRGLDSIAMSAYEKSYFYDVDAQYSETGYINSSVVSGLMNEQEKGYFKPMEPVSYQQVMKSLIRLLGYEPIIKARSGDENMYILLAAEKGISKNLTSNTSGYITRKNIYKAVINSLSVDILQAESYGEDIKYNTKRKQTILTVYHKVYDNIGIVQANSLTSLEGNLDLTYGTVQIGGEKYNLDQTKGLELIGYSVKFFYIESEGDKNIILIQPYRNDVFVITAENIAGCSNMQYTYYKNDKTEKINFAGAYILYNGVITQSVGSYIPRYGSVTLIDNDQNDKYEVLKINDCQDMVVKQIDKTDKRIYGVYGDVVDFEQVETVTVSNAVTGDILSFSDIFVNDILTISYDANHQNIDVKKNMETKGGIVTSLLDETIPKVALGNEVYPLSYSLQRAIQLQKIAPVNLGMKAKFYFNLSGEVIYYEKMKELRTEYEYGLLMAGEINHGLTQKLKIKIYTTFDDYFVYEVNDNAYVDEIRQKNTTDVYSKLCKDGENGALQTAVVPQMIRFKLNDSSVITHIDLATDKPGKTDGLYKIYNPLNQGSMRYYQSALAFAEMNNVRPVFGVATSTTVFVVDSNSSDTAIEMDSNVSIANVAEVYSTGETYSNFIAYGSKADSLDAEILLTFMDKNPVLSKSDPFCIFIKTVEAVNKDGEVVTKVCYSYDGTIKESVLDEDIDLNNLTIAIGGSYALKQGDIFRFKKTMAGVITYIEPTFDIKNNRFLIASYVSGYPEYQIRYDASSYIHLYKFSGIEKISGKYARMVFKNPAEFSAETDPYLICYIDYFFRTANKAVVYNKATNKVRKATKDDLWDYATAGNQCSKGIVVFRSISPEDIILYED